MCEDQLVAPILPHQVQRWDTCKSFFSLLARFMVFNVLIAALLLIPAGRLDWIEDWLFLSGYSFFLMVYKIWGLVIDHGQLSERSKPGVNAKSWDRISMSIYSVLLLVMLALSVMEAGRCRWSTASLAKESLGWMGMALVGGLIFCVVSVNTDLSRMVRIQNDRGHTVITSGPGRFVHHPMYFIFMFLWYWVPIGD